MTHANSIFIVSKENDTENFRIKFAKIIILVTCKTTLLFIILLDLLG